MQPSADLYIGVIMQAEKISKTIDPSLKLMISNASPASASAGTYYNGEQIVMRPPSIQRDISRLRGSGIVTDETTLFWMVFVHELGHHIDYLANAFKHQRQCQRNLDEAIRLGNSYQVRYFYRLYYKAKMQVEETAWKLGEPFLPAFIDRSLYHAYKQFCLQSYQQSFVIEYRLQRLKLLVYAQLDSFFKTNTDYTFTLDGHFIKLYDQTKNETRYNLMPYVYRDTSKSTHESSIDAIITTILDDIRAKK